MLDESVQGNFVVFLFRKLNEGLWISFVIGDGFLEFEAGAVYPYYSGAFVLYFRNGLAFGAKIIFQ